MSRAIQWTRACAAAAIVCAACTKDSPLHHDAGADGAAPQPDAGGPGGHEGGMPEGGGPAEAGVEDAATDAGAMRDAVADAGDDGGESPAEGAEVHVRWGAFAPLASYAGTLAPRGVALIEVDPASGQTAVHVQVLGVAPDTDYPVHVHAGPCAADGLGHYELDPSVEEVVADNEIWPLFTSDAAGVGHGSAAAAHVARGDALSVVVHDPAMDGAKMACADLLPSPQLPATTASGTFAPYAGMEAVDAALAGSAALRWGHEASELSVDVTLQGLVDDHTYSAHLHDLPCDVQSGGGHYKVDPSIADTLEDNELWFDLSAPVAGQVTASASDASGPGRSDAQAVVVHRSVPGGDALRVACATLVPDSHALLRVTGEDTTVLPAGEERGLAATVLEATITRGGAERTHVALQATGLPEGKTYGVHVHDRPCDVDSGGGHYKIDASVEEALEDNEIWLALTPNAALQASDTASLAAHVARPEAQSLVVHDPEDGARLLCYDLDVRTGE